MTDTLPPPGPERDRLVAEALGQPFRTPRHGTCCTCQVCGWDYEACHCGYSTSNHAALGALEAAVDGGVIMGYEITRYNKHAGCFVKAWRTTFRAVADLHAPTLGDAASRAIIEAKRRDNG